MMNRKLPLCCEFSLRCQQGVALLVAMIALVVMALAGVALLRSVDTNALIAGNLAFRQAASNSGDSGIETAMKWITGVNSDLEKENSAAGYYPTWQDTGDVPPDLTGNRTTANDDNVKWVNADGSTLSGQYTPFCLDEGGNKICYVIHRMCLNPGPLEGNWCSLNTSLSSAGNSAGALLQNLTYQNNIVGERLMGFYRITVRVAGPRNNASYVQALVQY